MRVLRLKSIVNQQKFLASQVPSIKDIGMFLAVFDTALPYVRIMTLIYLIYTF